MMARMPRFTVSSAALAVASLAVAGGLEAQNVVLDEGRFSLFVNGRDVGSETFSIHRVGMGQDARILATATVTFDGTEMHPVLDARPDFVPTSYQNELKGARTAELSVVLNGSRYVSRMSSPEGELQREYRASARMAVLDDQVAHQYYFVARFVDEGSGPIVILIPAAGEQARLEVVSNEVEPFRLGDAQVQARHIRLQGGGAVRDLWVDDQGRVLRVEIPEAAFRAERVPAGS